MIDWNNMILHLYDGYHQCNDWLIQDLNSLFDSLTVNNHVMIEWNYKYVNHLGDR